MTDLELHDAQECEHVLCTCDGAVYRLPNGNVYRGEFANGLSDGIGMLQVNAIGSSDSTQVRLPVPGVYVGEFKGGKLSGQGAVSMSGAAYLGTFRDNTFKEQYSRRDTHDGF
jgi:hypothetical protein